MTPQAQPSPQESERTERVARLFVHANPTTPPSAARSVEALVPDDVSSETFDPTAHTGWDDPLDVSIAQGVGKAWITQRRSALLIVPSVVTGGRDTKVVVNPEHPDAARIAVGPEQHVHLDPRFFR